MNSMLWIQIIWLTVTLGVMLTAYRTYNVGGKKTLVMALAWIGIFLLATAIASFFYEPEIGRFIVPEPDPGADYI